MNINAGNAGVAGYYTFELNGVPVFSAPSKNLITDFGWNRLMNLTKSPVGSIQVQVGTSNVPPNVTDTALGALVATRQAGSAAIGTGTDAIGAYSYSRFTFSYAQGAVVGNIAEVGLKVASGDTSLTSRSLVKDGLGNPAIIVVTAIDKLTVNYELRYYRDALDMTSSVTVAGVPTTYTIRTGPITSGTAGAAVIGGMNPLSIIMSHYGTGTSLGAPGSSISGFGEGAGSGSCVSKVINPTTGVVTFTTFTVATSSGNSTGGILNINMDFDADGDGTLGAYGNIKVGFSPAIPKNSTKTINYSFSFTFTRL